MKDCENSLKTNTVDKCVTKTINKIPKDELWNYFLELRYKSFNIAVKRKNCTLSFQWILHQCSNRLLNILLLHLNGLGEIVNAIHPLENNK